MRRATCAYLITLACAVAACSSSTTGSPPAGSSGNPPAGSSANPPAHSAGPHTLLATDSQNGGTLNANVGDVVRVRLASTYWRFNALAGAVLDTRGAVKFAPGASCVPGGGCGTITQAYRAARPGTARITASRTTCGEALRCAPNQSSFSVTVVVHG